MQKNSTYSEVVNYLFDQIPMYQRIGHIAYKANLDNTIKLDNHFNHPHQNFKSIHVAGTNGKGSVSNLLASILMESGLRVGLYTSPHLKDFRERIRINKEMISESDVVDFVTQNRSIIDEIKPSFFELTVAMAFNYFEKQKIDVAVIEVGLGGRLDATNIINPLLSVITNIDLDHTQYLGTTLAEIATEKAGIIKPNIPVVIGEIVAETRPVFESIAIKNNSRLIEAEQTFQVPYATKSIDNEQIFQVYQQAELIYPNLACDLLGIYQRKNICTVLTCIKQLQNLNFNLDKESIYRGVRNVKANTSLMGRWQILGNNPLIVCDIAHNTNGLSQIVKQIEETPHQNLHMVIGTVNDKDVESMLKLLPQKAHYYFTQANIPRSLNAFELMNLAKKHHLIGNVYASVAAAITEAKKKSASNDLIFIGGSTFIVAEAL